MKWSRISNSLPTPDTSLWLISSFFLPSLIFFSVWFIYSPKRSAGESFEQVSSKPLLKNHIVSFFPQQEKNTPSAIRPTFMPEAPDLNGYFDRTNNNTVRLNWSDNNTNTEKYFIERSLIETEAYAIIDSVDGSLKTYTDASVSINQNYYYRVRAKDASGFSPYSNLKFVTTRIAPGSGNALAFDGEDDYVDLSEYLPQLIGSERGTIMGWFKTSSTLHQQLLSITTVNQGIEESLEIEMNNSSSTYTDETFSVNLKQGGNKIIAMYYRNGNGALADGKWHHFAVILGGPNRLYIDGIFLGPAVTTYESASIGDQTGFLNFTLANRMRIGNRAKDNDVNDVHFEGELDDISIWNQTFGRAEVRPMMCMKYDNDDPNLIHYWRMDAGSGGHISDSRDGLDGRLVNFETNITNNPSGWLLSGAPIGDRQMEDYDRPPDISITSGNPAESFRIQTFFGDPEGAHVYQVDEAPNVKTFTDESIALDTSKYWGTFVSEGTNPRLWPIYEYDEALGYDNVPIVLLGRNDNADPTWEVVDLDSLQSMNNILFGSGQRYPEDLSEFILGFVSPFLSSSNPAPNQYYSNAQGNIELVFSDAMDNSLSQNGAIQIQGSASGSLSSSTNIQFLDSNRVAIQTSETLQEGETVTLSIGPEARNKGGVSIISPKAFSFRVASSGGGVGRYTIENIISQSANRISEVFPADLNKDGNMDLIASLSGSASLFWYRNNGRGVFEPLLIRENFGGISHLTGADFNRDGLPDILAASENNNQLSLFLNGNAQTFQEQSISNTIDNFSDIQVTDLNGDGYFDLVATSFNQDRIVWFPWNSQRAGFDPEIQLANNLNGLSSIILGDLDEDRDMDIVLAATNDDLVIWMENNGRGTFSSPVIISDQATGVSDLALGDMDGDGDNDIVYASNAGDQLALFLNQGEAIFGTASSITSPDGISDLELGDLDADGDLDVVYNSLSNDRLSWQANNGNGSFMPETNISTSANGLADIQLADLDGDGDLEVIAALSSDNTLIWYRNDDDFLDAPSNLSLTITSNEQIDLQWTDNSNNEDFFEIQRSVEGDEFIRLDTVMANVQTFSDPGLSTDIEYCYRVRAVNASSSSDFTNVACETIPATIPPDAPSNLFLDLNLSNGIRVNLSWTDNADNEQNFVLERSIDGSTFIPLENTDIDFNTQNFVDLLLNVDSNLGSVYCYRVKAVNQAGDSEYSNEICVLIGPPSNEIILEAVAINSSSVQLDWALVNAVPYPLRYIIERRNGSSFEQLDSTETDTLRYLDLGLLANIEYCYRVKAFNEFGSSDYSNEACARPVSNQILLPNLFTPNNDNNNDRFILRSLNVIEVDIRVFDRFGNIVFETSSVEQATDSGWDGQNQPNGSYAWVARVRFNDGELQEARGKVNLFR